MFYYKITIAIALVALTAEARSYGPTTPDYQKCRYGRYQADLGNEELCNPWRPMCAKGYNCQGGPADQPGPCCKAVNPCKVGEPYSRDGDAPNCLKNYGLSTCPKGYTCIGTKETSSVCCKGCTYEGKTYFPSEEFYNKLGEHCTCLANGHVTCSKKVPCNYGGKTYSYGEQKFPKGDGCNVCTCLKDGTVTCTNNPCFCKYKNVKYNIGQKFDDGCKKCVCTKTGDVTCTDQYCPVPCKYGGKTYSYEGPTFPKGDGCNVCTCLKDGTVSCTNNPCYCKYKNVKYNIGQEFNDGCKKCTCLKTGEVTCTDKFCPVPCKYGGKTYTYEGPTFPKGDGCNVCTCLKDGTVTCTNNPCYCKYKNVKYDIGQKFDDGCKKCVCTKTGEVTCTDQYCPVPCKYGGKTYTYEGPKFPKGDGCNVCTCLKDGTVTCTNNPCYCKYKNVKYDIGQKFDDGCKKCVCSRTGEVTCTDKYCPVPCTYGGKTYTYEGPTFPKGDGCNVCTCLKDGTVTCTNNPCFCKYKKVKYSIGQKFKDGCQSCTCTKTGDVACTDEYCPVYCHYNGQKYSSGETFPATDGCNQCTCQQNGQVTCGNKQCNTYPTKVYCMYNYVRYSVGETFQSTDGCNQCTCLANRKVSCGNKTCQSYPG